MKMSVDRKYLVLFCIGLLALFAAAVDAASPVFEYRFPESFDGTSPACTDLSAAGNNALIYGLDGYVSDERPAGFSSGGSLYGAAGGFGFTENINLLGNTAVAANGGYYFDLWVKPQAWAAGEIYPSQIIDYNGTEGLRLTRMGTEGDYTYYFEFRGNEGGTFAINSDPVTLGQWYHIKCSFDTLDGLFSLSEGFGVLSVNDMMAEKTYSKRIGKSTNVYNRPIGLNNWSGNYSNPSSAIAIHQGYVYNPTVGLGPHDDLRINQIDPGEGNTVGIWKLDESPGATTAVDSGPNALHGTLVGDVAFETSGLKKAARFNTANSDGYINVTHTDLFESESFTVAFWAKQETSTGTQTEGLLSNHNAYRDESETLHLDGYYITMVSNTGVVTVSMGNNDESWTTLNSNSGALASGVWSHIALSYDGDRDFARLYVDGVLADFNTVANFAPNLVNDLQFGRSSPCGNGYDINGSSSVNPFFGYMDDIKLYDYVMNSEQIAALAQKIAGDANMDSIVNEDDAAILANNWLVSSGANWGKGDFNGDGAVNDIDATILAANWQKSISSASVPEPSLLTLMGIGFSSFVVLMWRNGRKR